MLNTLIIYCYFIKKKTFLIKVWLCLCTYNNLQTKKKQHVAITNKTRRVLIALENSFIKIIKYIDDLRQINTKKKQNCISGDRKSRFAEK